MAKKARTPPPPSRRGPGGPKRPGRGDQPSGGKGDDAPKRRPSTTSAPGGLPDFLRNPRVLIAGGVGIVAIIAVIVVVAASGGNGGGGGGSPMPVAQLEAAGCTPFASAEAGAPFQGSVHYIDIPPDYEFSTSPRTAGIHNPQLLLWNLYTDPVDQMLLGHNLEHGGIFVQYGPEVPQETIDEIARWWQQDPNGIIVAPLPTAEDEPTVSADIEPTTIALGAWYSGDPDGASAYSDSTGELAFCTTFDEAAFNAFVDAFRGKGPEGVPVEFNTPASGGGVMEDPVSGQ